MRRMTLCQLFVIGLAIAVGSATGTRAENVDLSTVPDRNTVQLTIYNSEDLTLVRETRKISLKRGINPLQFSWANTLIDPTSVELKFLTHRDELEVLDTTFPHAKPQLLYWNVESEFDGEATIEITYFTSGIRWSADYVLVADQDETKIAFEGFVRVFNDSGEEYEDAQVRLVVGEINLVERIAQLASIGTKDVADLGKAATVRWKKEAVKYSMFADADSSGAGLGEMREEKGIIKEGLSEYFLFTIDGTETIANGWSKRMRSVKPVDVPLKIQYRYREVEYGSQLVRMYLMRNDVGSNLGTSPLPDGIVRVFRDNGRDGLSFLASQSINYIPIGDEIELNLGVDSEVVFELVKGRVWRDHIWIKVDGADVFRRVDDGNIAVDVRGSVAGWDEHAYYIQHVRNFSGKPIELEIRRLLPGHVVFRNGLGAVLHDYQTVQVTAKVTAGQRAQIRYEVVQHMGRNEKQANVKLVDIR
ncbi:MAG: hypothetical protein H6821_08000 [Planctomycetaceae bacterium]|nr:hypothetical protein [Planctomycetales bacterium]MCB9874108.1 hypothetical protein [Planctomycetaceae bacterium]MCB9940561.1 hypothetical protein [Planctomycetaceae bacterium]HRX77838.1 hypothetical protein [Pirellulaceae bacterium]